MDADGIGVDPDKIQAIKDLNPPSNVLDVRRFLGMVNQLSKFSGRLALLTEPLRELLKKKNEWNWGHLQESAFRDNKKELSSTRVWDIMIQIKRQLCQQIRHRLA
jgi:hypothetical protein